MGALNDLLALTDPNRAKPSAAPKKKSALEELLEVTNPQREDTQSDLADTGSTIARGALDTGVGGMTEGLLRMGQAVEADAAKTGGQGPAGRVAEINAQRNRLLSPVAFRDSERERNAMQSEAAKRDIEKRSQLTPSRAKRLDAVDAELAEARAVMEREQQGRLKASELGKAADKVAEFRGAVRDVYPVDKDFERSIGGQVTGGVSQMVASLPAFLSGMGIPAAAGQMFDSGYQDAKASGADDMTALTAGAMNLPGAGLEFAADKLALGGVLDAFKAGKITRAALAQEVVKKAAQSFAAEGATEGLQQMIQNAGAKALYDRERALTEGAGEAALVGGFTGATVASGSTLAGEGMRRMSDDTGENVPEAAETLKAQQRALVEGRQRAQMFPKGTAELSLPEGFARVETPRGVFHFDPDQVTAEEVTRASAAGRENDVLGLGPASKADVEKRAAAGEPLGSVVEQTPDGREVKAAMATPSTAQAAAAEMNARKAPENTVALRNPAEVVQARTGGGLVADMLAKDKAAAVEREQAQAREILERETRQKEAAAKRARFDETVAAAGKIFRDPGATFAQVQGALEAAKFYAEDNSLGLTQEQREMAQRATASLTPKLEQLRAAEEAKRDAESRARQQAEAQAEADRRARIAADKAAVKNAEAAGIGADGALDYGRLTDEQLGERAQAGDQRASKEMDRRVMMGDQPQRENLRDVLAELKLPATDAKLGAELQLLKQEVKGPEVARYFSTKKDSLDRVAEALRERGFSQIRTPDDVIKWAGIALRGKPVWATEPGRAEVDFARARERRPRMDEAAQQRTIEALRRSSPELIREYDVEAGLIGDLLGRYASESGKRLGPVPAGVQAAVTRSKGRRGLIAFAADAFESRAKVAALASHEIGHLYWDSLGAETQQLLRELRERELAAKSGPLFDDKGEMRTALEGVDDKSEWGVKEWFAERIARLNEAWADGRIGQAERAGDSLLRRLAYELREFVRRIWEGMARQRGVDVDSELFENQFRQFWLRGADAKVATAASTAYARQVEFARERGVSRQPFPTWTEGGSVDRADYERRRGEFFNRVDTWTRTQPDTLAFQRKGDRGKSVGSVYIVSRNANGSGKPWRWSWFDNQKGALLHEEFASKEAAVRNLVEAGAEPADDINSGKVEFAQAKIPQYKKNGAPKAAEAIAGPWRDIMPSFQGNKREMAAFAADQIRKNFSDQQRNAVETVNDYFGGGGAWGLHLALAHFPNAKRLIVHEFNPDRLGKIRLFHERGADIRKDLERVAPQIQQASQQMIRDGVPSPAAFVSRLRSQLEGGDEQAKTILAAIEDYANNDRASALDESGKRDAELSVKAVLDGVVRSAEESKRGADAFKSRGGKIEYVAGDSYGSPIVPGAGTVAVFDPPYYKTTGYNGSGIVPIDIYRKTADYLNKLAEAGNGVVYTDSAWWIDEQNKALETAKNDSAGSLFDQTQVASVKPDPEGREALGFIVDSLENANIVPIAKRHEILVVHPPGSSERARRARGHHRGAVHAGDRSAGPAVGGDSGAPVRGDAAGSASPRETAGERAGDAQRESAEMGDRRTGGQSDLTLRDIRGEINAVQREIEGLRESQEDDVEARGAELTVKLEQLRKELRDAEREEQAAAMLMPASALEKKRAPAPSTEKPSWLPTDEELDAAEVIERAPKVEALPPVDRKKALMELLWHATEQARKMRAKDSLQGDIDAQWQEKRAQQTRATLDKEFPGWEGTKAPAAAEPPKPPVPPETNPEAAQPDDGEPSPFVPKDEPLPVRSGKAAEVYGHSGATPSAALRTWDKVRDVIAGIRGSVPELPTFAAAKWNAADSFIRERGAAFYNRVKEGYRQLRTINDYVQKNAEENVARITRPLIRAGNFDAAAYKRLVNLQEQRRKAKADGRDLSKSQLATISALSDQVESSPYVIFQKLVLMLDLNWRQQNLKDSAGNPIRLPADINQAEVAAELERLSAAMETSAHRDAIAKALEQHMALVKQVSEDLKKRDLLAADHLENPYYFPHITLETTRGGKTEQRELSPERVRPGTEADFRGYLIDPVGSAKAIETDYVRAMYYHLVQVGAHNEKADIVQDYFRHYDVKKEVEARAKKLSRERGTPVSWEQAFHEEYAPKGYVLYGTDSRDAFPTVSIDRDKLARRLGVALTSEDLQKQFEQLGLKGVRLLPDDLKESMEMGARETWVVPARVAEALRGIAKRETHSDKAWDAAMKFLIGAWKRWKLFMPHNHIRYEFGNVTADLEKIFSADPEVFKHLAPAAKELRDFWRGGKAGDDLRAALKEGVLNAVTAAEMNGLAHLPNFKEFQTKAESAWTQVKKRGSSVLLQPVLHPLGLGNLSSVEASALREGITRYAKFKADLARIRNGARPVYAGAYWKEVEAMGDSAPGANDAATRKAGAISKATFGDYSDTSVLGQTLREKFIPFYSWLEVNFKYHANLFRNLRDMVRMGETTRAQAFGQGAKAAAGFTTRAAAGFALRLALPYVAVALWNNSGDREDLEDQLSEEDKRRFHIILGKDEDGKVQLAYAPTAFMDVLKWFSGPEAMRGTVAWMKGQTDFATAFDSWRSRLAPDLVNNVVGQAGPLAQVPVALGTKKRMFPDVTDPRTIPDYDMRRSILSMITDEFTADMIERGLNKDYYAAKDFGDWSKQLIMQVRQRDPEAWAYYEIRDKAADFMEEKTGSKRDTSYNAPDQQVLRNFRKAIYQGDVPAAMRFYQRALEYGYTAERFAASVRAQDPLATLAKKDGLRREFVDSLSPFDREQLKRAFMYYDRMNGMRGKERQIFPSDRTGDAGLKRYQERPRYQHVQGLADAWERRTEEETRRRAEKAERESLAPARR